MFFTNKLNFIAVLFAIITGFATASAQTFSGGDGTETSPYLISTVEDLQQLAKNVNSGSSYTATYLKLAADLNLSSVCGSNINGEEVSWTPIGTSSNPFRGHFDGAGHTISNLYINDNSKTDQGLFGFIRGASISNLALVNVKITASQYAGGIAGYGESNCTIESCTVSGDIEAIANNSYVGGILGGYYEVCNVSYCLVSGTVTGDRYVGGIAGSNGTTQKCVCNAIVNGNSWVGAITNEEFNPTTKNYYDKQMNPVFKGKGGMIGPDGTGSNYGLDKEGVAEGKLTSELTSGNLFNEAAIWSEAAGRYPIPASLVNNEAALLTATPILLAATNADSCETVKAIKTNFSVGVQNDVMWSSSNSSVKINAEDGSVDISKVLVSDNQATLTVTDKDGMYSKTVEITIDATYGGESNPITIDSAEDLVAFRDAINDPSYKYKELTLADGGAGLTFLVTNDLDLSSFCGAEINGETSWTPIGISYLKPFKGNFDGDGHTISNLYINSPAADYQGLFGFSNGSINNLKLADVNVLGNDFVGGLCGYTVGGGYTISNCSVSGNVSGRSNVGGLCGQLDDNKTLINCINTGNISGSSYVGGLCGQSWLCHVSNCINIGYISGSNKVGGIIGENTGYPLSCINYGNVTGATYVGGICGNTFSLSTITYCINVGQVNGTENSGDICGSQNGLSSIVSCYYDKQMCSVGGIDGTDITDSAEGSLTTDMTGTKLSSLLGTDYFVYADDLYPRLKGFETTDASIVAATPLFLSNNEVSTNVENNFTVGVDNGVVWSSDNTQRATISGSNVTLAGKGDVTLVANLGNAQKSITLTFSEGAAIGTEQNPHTIDNIDDFVAFRDGINSDASFDYKGISVPVNGYGIYFKLTADIDLSSICYRDTTQANDVSWTPIGLSYEKDFEGHFDGAGHTISNLYINNSSESNQGLFGYICRASISNLALVNVKITAFDFIGGIAGYGDANCSIESCTVSGDIKSSNSSGDSYVGGILGSSSGSTIVSYCLVSGTVTASSPYVGGIAGYSVIVQKCVSNAIVNGPDFVGGITNTMINSTTNNYYDKQMNPDFKGMGSIAGIGGSGSRYGSDSEGVAEGKLTSELTSGNLFNEAAIWSEAAGRYPIPASLVNNEAALLTATPILLAATNADSCETVKAIKTNFSVGVQNDVMWSSSNSSVKINAEDGSVDISKVLVSDNQATLTVTDKDGMYSKTVEITIDATYGGESNPITIDSAEDLVAFRDAINDPSYKYKELTLADGGAGLTFLVTNDLDLSSFCGAEINGETSWTPIGISYLKPFKGNFDGDGHTISNLYINSPAADYQGLFGYLFGKASVDNLNLVDVDVLANDYVAGLCGLSLQSSSVNNCTVSGKISGNNYVAGLCGNVEYGSISNCINTASVSGGSRVGGMTGHCEKDCSINNSVNTGSISGTGILVGGIVGSVNSAALAIKITYCINYSNVTGNDNVGGICGYINNGGIVMYCISVGSLNGVSNLGALCGSINTSFVDSSSVDSSYYDRSMVRADEIGVINNNIVSAGFVAITGERLSPYLGTDNFVYTDDLYPRIKGLENTDASLAAAAPIFLASGDTINNVRNNFTVGIDNNVVWTSKNGKVEFVDDKAYIKSAGEDILYASINGIVYKTIVINLSSDLGSVTNPYVIDEVSDLQALAAGVNTKKEFSYWDDNSITIPALASDCNFKLTADLDLSSVCGPNIDGKDSSWTPIGISYSIAFEGGFYGAGHTISNLYINDSVSNYQGLFGVIKGAIIDSLILVDSYVKGANYVGGLCGSSNYNSSVSNCTVSGSVSGNRRVGGVCGSNTSASINNCINVCNVDGDERVAGICGHASTTTITNCVNNGNVSATNNWVGGLCGRVDNDSYVSSCINNGSVSGFVGGGVCGMLISSYVSNCVNYGSVNGTASIGAVAGRNDNSTITSCYYDKQMCITGGISGSDVSGSAEGLLTTEMTGTKLSAVLGTDFVYTDGLYPRLKGFETTDAAIVAATPIFLTAESSSDYETVDSVLTNFMVNTQNNVEWTVTPLENATISESLVELLKRGKMILTAGINGVEYKSIVLNVVKKPTTATWTVADYTYGETLTGKLNASVEETEGTFIYKNGETVLTEDDKLDAGDYTLLVEFTPTDTVNYKSSTDTASFTVGKAATTVAWTVADYTYGETLTGKFNASVEETEGTFIYKNGETVLTEDDKLDAGDYTLLVEFTPTDTVNYKSSTDTASFTVGKAATTVTWTVADYTYGETLAGKLNASVEETEGTFVYKNGETVLTEDDKLDAGDYTLLVEFTPTDSVNYFSSSDTASFTVGKAATTISWESPESIVEGTALSSVQLNATADVAGAFVYTPEEGTILESGTDTLRVEFIPSDTVNYSKATFAVEIIVEKSTDVEEILQNGITLYPNPTTLGFYIDLGTAETTPIEIYDQNGRLIQTVEVSGKQFVDISNYAQGIYLVKAANRKACKVVKQ